MRIFFTLLVLISFSMCKKEEVVTSPSPETVSLMVEIDSLNSSGIVSDTERVSIELSIPFKYRRIMYSKFPGKCQFKDLKPGFYDCYAVITPLHEDEKFYFAATSLKLEAGNQVTVKLNLKKK